MPHRSPSPASPQLGHPPDAGAAVRISPPTFAFEAVPTRAIATLQKLATLPRLVLLHAPSGYGKSVTLSRLHAHCQAQGMHCLWITLDDRDRDLGDLLYLLQLALPPEHLHHANIPPRPSAQQGNTVERLCQAQRPTVLFIDNLGFCKDPRLAALLAQLVFHSNGHLHLALSSIEPLPLDIVRAKLELQVLELQSDHLSLDRQSTARLLQAAGLNHPSAGQLDRILQQTEGWPAAVRLLQVWMSSAPAPAAGTADAGLQGALDRFGGDQRDMAQMLARRVLADFDPALVVFMLEVALAREFSAALAQRMTGQADARERLALLLERNVLIFPVDRKQQWFRFHTLMREYLLAEGRLHLRPERRRDVLAQAAAWHAEEGDEVTALEIALEAPAVPLATHLIDRVAQTVVGKQGRMAPYIRWYAHFVRVGGSPSINAHAWYVWALCHALRYEATRQALDALDRRLAEAPAAPQSAPVVHSHMHFLRLVIDIYLDRLDEADQRAREWLDADLPRTPLSQGTAFAVASVAALERGEMRDARHLIASARAAMTRAASHWGLTWDDVVLAIIEIHAARPDLAERILHDARERARTTLGEASDVLAILDFVQARAALDLGRVAQAAQHARQGLARATDQGLILTAEQGLLTCVALWTPDAPEGLRADAIDQAIHRFPPRLHTVVSAGWLRRLLALGQVTQALDLAGAAGLHGITDPTAPDHPPLHGERLLAWADLQAAQGHGDTLLDRIDSLQKAPHLHDRQRDRVELCLVACELHHRAGRQARAVQALAQAIGLAAPGKLLHPFQRRERCLRSLLAQHREREFGLIQPQDLAFLARLNGLFNPTPLSDPTTAAEAPTPRELQLLGLLNQGLSNQQVADQLALSVTTVKWHLRNLYAKLGVGRRSAALAKARAHRMLPQ